MSLNGTFIIIVHANMYVYMYGLRRMYTNEEPQGRVRGRYYWQHTHTRRHTHTQSE